MEEAEHVVVKSEPLESSHVADARGQGSQLVHIECETLESAQLAERGRQRREGIGVDPQGREAGAPVALLGVGGIASS